MLPPFWPDAADDLILRSLYEIRKDSCFLLLIYAFILGVLPVPVNVPVSNMMMRITDPAQLGRVQSVSGVLTQGLIPVAVFLGGILIRLWGSSGLLLFCSLGFVIPILLLQFEKSVAKL